MNTRKLFSYPQTLTTVKFSFHYIDKLTVCANKLGKAENDAINILTSVVRMWEVRPTDLSVQGRFEWILLVVYFLVKHPTI